MKKSKFKTENTFNGKKMSKKQSEILRKALKDPNIKNIPRKSSTLPLASIIS